MEAPVDEVVAVELEAKACGGKIGCIACSCIYYCLCSQSLTNCSQLLSTALNCSQLLSMCSCICTE